MSLDGFGLSGVPALAVTTAFHGPWPRLDRHGNVYWWRCLEPRCTYRTDPEARGGGLWWTQQREHAAAAHPDCDVETLGHPTSLAGCHMGAPPKSYLRDEGWVTDPADTDD